MLTLHHKPLKKFGLEGIIHNDSVLWRIKEEYIKLLITEMQFSGYVPRLDIAPDFTIQFNHDKGYFEFELSLYGVYVGKKKSKWIAGVDETRVIPIQQNKLNEFSQEVA
jgi:hypothetical protein